jgi:hypothetical protein
MLYRPHDKEAYKFQQCTRKGGKDSGGTGR